MSDFLSAIPAAASSYYAFGAYAICGALFLLGGTQFRALQVVLKRIETVPADERLKTIQAITGSVIPEHITAEQWIQHQRNRSIVALAGAALVLVAAILIIALVNPNPDPKPGPQPPAADAREVATGWLKKADAGDFALAYADMFKGFRERTTEAAWLELSTTVRKPLGDVEDRRVVQEIPNEFRAGRRLNGYQIMYFTKFSHMPAPISEVVTLASPGLPEPWSVTGYFVDVPPNSPTLKRPSSP